MRPWSNDSSFPPVRAVGRGTDWYRGDFIATTEHNAAAAPGIWGHLAADDFLIALGEEVTTKTGHWLALGIHPGEVVDWNLPSQGRADRSVP